MTREEAQTPERPLRLAYLADPSSVHTQRWLTFFAARGHAVTILVYGGESVPDNLPAGIAIHRVGWAPGARRLIPASIRLRRALRRAVRETHPDIVHAHYLTRHGWAARVAGFHPYVITLWGSDILVAPLRSWRTRIKAWLALRDADLVTVAADHIGDAARSRGARADRVRLIHFGIDTARFRPGAGDPAVLARLGLTGLRYVFSPRSLTPLYRHDTILRAFATLPPDVALVTAGLRADEDHLAALHRLAAELGLGDRLIVLPAYDETEAPSLFAGALAVVSVPESDGQPATVLEAMAAGTPVIASDLPGPRTFLRAFPHLLVPVGDDRLLATALQRAMDLGPEERQALGLALRQIVIDRFGYETHMLQMEREYRRLLPGGSGSDGR